MKWGSEFEAVGAIVQSLHVVGLFDDSLDGWTDGWMREKKGGRRKLLDGQRGSTGGDCWSSSEVKRLFILSLANNASFPLNDLSAEPGLCLIF